MTSGSQIFTRTVEIFTGFIAWKAYDYLFDYALFPVVIWKLGPWQGGLLMTSLSLFLCLLLLWIYDWLRRDWIGIEFVKNLRHYEGPSRWQKVLGWLVSRGDLMAFLVLSIKFGPFITTVYLRKDAYSDLTGRDWRNFLGSWLLSNTFWTFVCYGGVTTLRLLIFRR